MAVTDDIKKLAPGNLIVLYELDLSPCVGRFGQTSTETFRWCDGVNQLGEDITWQGNTYLRYPIQTQGFERTGDGSIPRPKIVVANIGGIISSLTRELNDIAGAKLTRTRTFARYLDAVNFSAGNPMADPTQYLDKEIWVIDRKAAENSVFVEWEMTTPFDLNSVKLPRRQCVQNSCPWAYRSAECSYTGTMYFDKNDVPVSTLAEDVCGKRLGSCKKRFGENAVLPYGGFPGVGLVK